VSAAAHFDLSEDASEQKLLARGGDRTGSAVQTGPLLNIITFDHVRARWIDSEFYADANQSNGHMDAMNHCNHSR
jgi:hypothetical protein